MNKNRLFQAGILFFALLAVTLLAACTQDELVDKGTALPEGKYPLELSTASLGAAATRSTRGTIDGTWVGGETICVQAASSLKYSDKKNIPWSEVPVIRYKVSQDETMALDETSTPAYWQSTQETKYIRAWYAGTKGYEGVPVASEPSVAIADWEVAQEQTETTLAEDDFLYAYTELTYPGNENNKLQFRHLLSKITINLVSTPYLKAHNKEEVSVSLSYSDNKPSWFVKGKFKESGSFFCLEYNLKLNALDKDITPCQLATSTNDAYVSYEALVIPQTVAIHDKVIKVQVGKATYTWVVEPTYDLPSFGGGKAYTFNITVKEHGLDVTVNESISWSNGTSGSGSVEIQ